jgi:hypothetical protein
VSANEALAKFVITTGCCVFGLKLCKDKDDQNEEWHYVQEGKVF